MAVMQLKYPVGPVFSVEFTLNTGERCEMKAEWEPCVPPPAVLPGLMERYKEARAAFFKHCEVEWGWPAGSIFVHDL